MRKGRKKIRHNVSKLFIKDDFCPTHHYQIIRKWSQTRPEQYMFLCGTSIQDIVIVCYYCICEVTKLTKLPEHHVSTHSIYRITAATACLQREEVPQLALTVTLTPID